MELEAKVCANEECPREGDPFIPRTHNAIYCSPECRTKVMNKKILARYHERRAQIKANIKRICEVEECETVLSKYNKEFICELHKEKRLDKRLTRWGWSQKDIDKWRNE
jgi:hypothetical protein